MARHYRLVLMALAVLLGAMSLAIAFGSTSTVFYGPEPGLYHFRAATSRRSCRPGPRSWPRRSLREPSTGAVLSDRGLGIGEIGVFVVFFLFAGGFGFTGWKEPTQAPGSLQAEPGR
jgi:hypothetical protein